jgi:HEAT repeat protein
MTAGQDSFVALLIERVKDPELTVRVHAGILLGGLGMEARPALSALLELRQSADVHDRRLAIMTLGSLGHDLAEAVPPLLDSLHDEDETVRRLAAEALEEMAPAQGQARAA